MHDAGSRRVQILAAAERLLGHYGPDKTTIAEIAREAGVSVGSVYLEFASKDALVEALSQDRNHQVLSAMMEAARATEGSGFEACWRAVFAAKVTALLAVAEDGAHASDLVFCQKSAVKEAHARFRARETELLAGMLRKGVACGELGACEPEETAKLLLTLYASFGPPWVYHEPAEALRARLDGVHQLLLRGLLKRAE